MRALLALLAAFALQDEGDGRAAPDVESAPTSAVLARSPGELPRAAVGAWAGFFPVAQGAQGSAGFQAFDADARAALGRAEERYAQGDFPAALEELFALLERVPDLPPAWLVLGTSYFRLRRYEDAALAYERFLEVAPGEEWRTQALGHCYYSLGDYERARAHYERVVAVATTSVEAWRGLALSHLRLGDERTALELLRRVLRLEPAHPEAHLWIARILYDAGKSRAAWRVALRARELDPFEPQPWYLCFQVLTDLGRAEEAAEHERRWKELDAIAQELRSVEARLRLEPRRFDLAWRRFELHRSSGNAAALRGDLERLLALRPAEVSESELRLAGIDALQALGDVEGARSAAAALEEVAGEDPEVWSALERFYAAVRDRVGQVRAGERARRFGGEGR